MQHHESAKKETQKVLNISPGKSSKEEKPKSEQKVLEECHEHFGVTSDSVEMATSGAHKGIVQKGFVHKNRHSKYSKVA
eukprot:3811530-Amphidinium_carterae.1